jgi:hypothetical protein
MNMTKTKEAVAPQEETVAITSVFDGEQGDRWVRDSALGYAMAHHKNNGGMTTPQQIISNADIFLNFLKGEDK